MTVVVASMLIGYQTVNLSGVLPVARADAATDADMQLAFLAWDRGDVVRAIDLYRRLAEQGHRPAQIRLGYILYRSNQLKAAQHWYQLAAENGEPEAQFLLGELYLQSNEIERNTTLAQHWIKRAAEGDHVPAMRLLATNYDMGGMGLFQDTERALHWLERAAALGDEWSAVRLRQLDKSE